MAEEIDRTSQILAYAQDSLQVVSYKWLSRKLSISSNESKRLLQIVADQHASELDVIYAMSGWSKTGDHCYSVKLVPKSRLQEAKDMLSGHVSIHVYSIQPCTPKDPAELWGAEYVQSEDLFKQPSEINNCLRDNRFSGVVCSHVTRKVIDKNVTGNAGLAASKTTGQSTMASKVGVPSPGATKVAAPTPTSLPQVSTTKAEVVHDMPSIGGQAKPSVQLNTGTDMAIAAKGSGALAGSKAVGASKKKAAGSGEGGSLANLWGRATTKSKVTHTESEAAAAGNAVRKETEVTNDPCIDGSSDDEDVANFARLRRGDLQNKSKRTRRMIVDDDISEEDDAEPVNKTPVTKFSPEKLKGQKEKETSVEPEKKGKKGQKGKEMSIASEKKGKRSSASPAHLDEVKENSTCTIRETETKELDAGNHRIEPSKVAANGSGTAVHEPKKRKVLKTRLDERGREVTEVVWEIENSAQNESVNKDNHANVHGEVQVAPTENPSLRSNTKASSASVQNPVNKGSGGAGKSSGKAATKDTQQGRISSFFKKKN